MIITNTETSTIKSVIKRPFTIKPISKLFAAVKGKNVLINCIKGVIKSSGRIIPLKNSIGTTASNESSIAVDCVFVNEEINNPREINATDTSIVAK